ncbi:MAG: sugar phosphate nucleotidyltransferase, partial [Dehalococcoidia bacterium]
LGGVKTFVDRFQENGANCQILLHPVDNPQAFGIAEFVDGRVARIVEKPASPPSNLAVIGIYMFDHHVFEAVERIKPSARGELEITDTIQYLIDKGLDVQAEVLDRSWIDTGKMDDILEANRMVLQSLTPNNQGQVDERTRLYEPVVLEKGARVVNSVLRGPLVIGGDTEIIDSYVGPFTSINHHCRLKGVRVGGSIILERTTIEDTHWPIEHSLIGRFVTLRGGHTVGGSYSLNLGDHSQIEMPEA